jgi:iron complex outermembrane receptor protein
MNKYILTIGAIFFLLSAFAQDLLKGKVTDNTGFGLPGVTIIIEGDFTDLVGTTSDYDGNFSIELPEGSQTITFKFIGFSPLTFDINDQRLFEVEMSEDISELDEVVVIGYGTVTKSDVTGAMSSLDPKDFNKGVMTNANEMMQGKASGIQINRSSGAPGASSNVRIRGISSISRSRGPLYVVDGVPIQGAVGAVTASGIDGGGTDNLDPLNYINPDDIISIDILKDASATAIYGSRGAAGVIIITTKKGEEGQNNLSFSSYASVSNIRSKIDVLTAEDWVKARQLLALETGNLTFLDENFGASTDWQNEIFRSGVTQNYSVSASGGTKSSNYLFSLSYMDQEGIVTNSGLNRVTGRLNLSQNLLNDILVVEANLTAANIKNQWAPVGNGGGAGGDLIGNALRANPTMPVYDSNGDYFQPNTTTFNPVAMAQLIDDQSHTDSFLANVAATFKIAKGLTNKTNIGLEISNTERNTNTSQLLLPLEAQEGIASIANNRGYNYLFENFTTYNFTKGVNDVTVMGGYAYQQQTSEFNTIFARGFDSEQILYTNNVGLSDPEIVRNIGSGKQQYEIQSFFGRLQYQLFNKYRLTASLRADGTSRFGQNNKYGFFPSAAFGWTLSDESFLQGFDKLSFLNLRLGYGKTGNDNVPDYQYLNLATFNNDGGIERTQIANPDLKWETTTMTNLGIDFGFLSDRLNGTLELFDKRTEDMLLFLEQPAPSIVPQKWVNTDAQLINRGVELNLTMFWLTSDKFSWSTTGVFTGINTTIENLSVPIVGGQLNGQGLVGTFIQIIDNGPNLWNFVLREHQGFDDQGISIFAGGENEQQSFTDDSPYENYIIGLTNNITYRNFDLQFFIESKLGRHIYNNTANTYLNKGAIAQGFNTSPADLVSARSINDIALASTYYLEDASFVRLANLTFGYNFPVTSIGWIQSARMYFTGQNIFLLTNYTGYDPDVNSSASGEGIDYTSYPNPRTWLFGFNINF